MSPYLPRHPEECERSAVYDVPDAPEPEYGDPGVPDPAPRPVPYPLHCVHPGKCAGRHRCPRDPVCIE